MPHEYFSQSMPLPSPLLLSPSTKPQPGACLLSILLGFIVLHIVLTFFFLFAGFAVVALLLLFLTGEFLRHPRRRFQRPSIENRGLSRDEMRRLACYRCSELAADDYVVCLQEFGEGEWCRVIPRCRHLFHRGCVDRWPERSRVCPICRGWF